MSKYTVQAWISPSSPNHKPEFARLARHAGKKTVFVESEVLTWVDQRRGRENRLPGIESSPYWFERFISGRGMLKNIVRGAEAVPKTLRGGFKRGKLGLDSGPLLAWLTDGPDAQRVYSVVSRAESLVISATLCCQILQKLKKIPIRYADTESFLLSSGSFDIAQVNENVIRRLSGYPGNISESHAVNCAASLEWGADWFATWNEDLLEIPGLPVIAP